MVTSAEECMVAAQVVWPPLISSLILPLISAIAPPAQVVGAPWSGYERSATQCATGPLAVASEAECSDPEVIAFTTFGYDHTPGNEWPQGCFINGNSIYFQGSVQQTQTTHDPSASDGGGEFICRNHPDPGVDWPRGCFLHAGKVR